MRRIILTTLILFCLVFASVPSAGAGVISRELQDTLNVSPPNQRIGVLITFADRVNLPSFNRTQRASRRAAIITALKSRANLNFGPMKAFLQGKGASRMRELWIANSMAAVLPAFVVAQLQNFPGIASIRLDEVIQLPRAMPAADGPVTWNVSAVHAPELWELGFTGSGVVVASMDSGVDINHSDLAGRWRGGINSWYDPNGEHATPIDNDPDGHGTGTMGIMVGGDATGSVIGMAPGAQWIAVKIFNDANMASHSAIHLGFQWFFDPDGDSMTDDSPDVVNNSWGFKDLIDNCFLEFQYDIQALKAAGIAVVFSAGNEGPGASTSISPANNEQSFAVGAVSSSLTIAGFSSRGPSACVVDNDFFPEIVAPGVSIKTADITTGGLVPDASAYRDGTSFAAPHVAGAMALLLEAFPAKSPEELESALTSTAMDLGDPGPDDDYGYGMVDVLAAYRALVPCTDFDGDGFFAEAECAVVQDCDDNDPAIYPGAVEVKHDGIDQDCNGYDLTIEIDKAVYESDTFELEVIATSMLDDQANLNLVGFGPMSWVAESNHWEITLSGVGLNPGILSVAGTEGTEMATTTICPGTTDSDGDGWLDDCDNCIDVANPDQRDTNGDGFGNVCDTDLNNDGITNGLDVGVFKLQFLTPGPDAEFNGDGIVNGLDVGVLKIYFLQPPGPSGLVP